MNNFHDPDHWRFQHEYAEGYTNDSPVDLSGREGAPRKVDPEATGIYECPNCGNRVRFTGIDINGWGGAEACESDCQDECKCSTELSQAFEVLSQNGTREGAEIDYEAHMGGGYGAEIGSYTKIICRDCDSIIWEEV